MVAIILIFILFSLYTFLTNIIWVLLGFTISNLLLIIIYKIKPIQILKNFYRSLILIGIIFAFNLIFDNLINSLIISWKIFIVAQGSFIFSNAIPPHKMAIGFYQLLTPLKIFKVNITNISLMLVIAFNFIPIISNDIFILKQTLKARNVKLNLKTFFTKSHIIFTMFFANLFKRVNQLEESLRARNYKSD